jgi:alpha/beta superfamily hydrolase
VGSSEGEHAHMTGEIEDARAALQWLRARYPALPFALAGFSFGARVITRLGCQMQDAAFVMAVGYSTERDNSFLETCPVPKIFVQSTHDQFGPREQLAAVYARLAEPKELIWIEAGDHFFQGALEELEERVRAAAARAAGPAEG